MNRPQSTAVREDTGKDIAPVTLNQAQTYFMMVMANYLIMEEGLDGEDCNAVVSKTLLRHIAKPSLERIIESLDGGMLDEVGDHYRALSETTPFVFSWNRRFFGLTYDGARWVVAQGWVPEEFRFVLHHCITGDSGTFDVERGTVDFEALKTWREANWVPLTSPKAPEIGSPATVASVTDVVDQMSYTAEERMAAHKRIDAMKIDPKSRAAFKAHVTRRTLIPA